MDKVIVTKCMVGAFGMQVCAEKGVSDKEILEVCNKENPAGTEAGWGIVLRHDNLEDNHMTADSAPVKCEDEPNRFHYLVLC